MVFQSVSCHIVLIFHNSCIPGPEAQSVPNMTADPGVVSLISARSHTQSGTFLEIDLEIISTVIPLFPLIQEELLSVRIESICMCRKYWLTTK